MARRPRGTGWGVQAWLSFDMSVNRTGSWAKSGNVVTLAMVSAHNLQVGNGVHLTFTGTGAPTNDYYIVVSTPTATSFTISTSTGTGTAGDFACHLVVRDSFNISKVLRPAQGTAQITFEKAFANSYYSVASTPVARVPGGVETASQHTMLVLVDVPSTTGVTIRNVTGSNFTADLAYVGVQFCGRQ